MSHHIDYLEDGRLDVSDLYCFRGQSGTVLAINVAPLSASGFHPDALYELKVDTNGDAVENITFRTTFTAPGLVGGQQQVKLEMLTGRVSRDRDATGRVLVEGTTGEILSDPKTGIKFFAGERGEPFYVDARVFVEMRRAMNTGTAADFSWYDPNTVQNTFGNSNVSAIVIELPAAITGTGTIGVWGTSVVPAKGGGWRQLQTAGNPDINASWDFQGGSGVDYNTVEPKDKKAVFGDQVARQTAAVVKAMGTYDDPTGYGTATPEEYGEYVRDSMFPDVLRYEVGTDAHFGVRGNNGRGLTEDVTEAFFERILNKRIEFGMDASDATGELLDSFPYLSEPIKVNATARL